MSSAVGLHYGALQKRIWHAMLSSDELLA